MKDFDLDTVTGDDPRAAKLTRVLAYYARASASARSGSCRPLVCVPPRLTLDLLGVVIDAGGEVAGLLVNAKPRLARFQGLFGAAD